MIRASLGRGPDTGPKDIPEDEYITYQPQPLMLPDSLTEELLRHVQVDGVYDFFFTPISYINVHNNRLFYANMYNPMAQVVSALDNVRTTNVGDPRVSPRHWSDLVFPTWELLNDFFTDIQGGRNGIQYIFQTDVGQLNQITMDIINEIITDEDRRNNRYYWTFEAANFGNQANGNFWALMGTPAVLGSAHICINYPQSMDYEVIRKITIYYHQIQRKYSLIIEFGRMY